MSPLPPTSRKPSLSVDEVRHKPFYNPSHLQKPCGCGQHSTKAPDFERAVSDVVNFDPALGQSFLQSLPLKLYTVTFNDFLNNLFGFSNSPLSWIIIGLVGWQVIWKQSGHNEIKN